MRVFHLQPISAAVLAAAAVGAAGQRPVYDFVVTKSAMCGGTGANGCNQVRVL